VAFAPKIQTELYVDRQALLILLEANNLQIMYQQENAVGFPPEQQPCNFHQKKVHCESLVLYSKTSGKPDLKK